MALCNILYDSTSTVHISLSLLNQWNYYVVYFLDCAKLSFTLSLSSFLKPQSQNNNNNGQIKSYHTKSISSRASSLLLVIYRGIRHSLRSPLTANYLLPLSSPLVPEDGFAARLRQRRSQQLPQIQKTGKLLGFHTHTHTSQ